MGVNVTKNIDFTQPANFQANPEIVINGNGAQLVPINNLQPDWMCGAKFDTNLNLNWGGGFLIGTPHGAVITGGKLDLTGNNKYLDFSAAANANSQQKGTIKLKFTPDYSGTPSVIEVLFNVADNGNPDNVIACYHNTDGILYIAMFDKDGSQLFNTSLATWSPVSGTEYEFALCYDITAGATRLFIDGIQFGSTVTATGLRDTNISLLRLGGNWNGTLFCDGYIRDLLVTNDVLYTANYTPGYTIPAQAQSYPTDSPAILPEGTVNQLPTTGLISMISNSQIPNGTDVKMVVKRADGFLYYYNGSAWVESSGASQSNSISSITSVILEALNLSDGEIIEFYFYLVSVGNLTPTLVNLTITAEQYLPNEDNITPCTVYGYTVDASGKPVTGVSVTATLPTDEPYEEETLIVESPAPAISNGAGYWQLDLLPLEVAYKFTFVNGSEPAFEVSKKVPAEQSAAFNTLAD